MQSLIVLLRHGEIDTSIPRRFLGQTDLPLNEADLQYRALLQALIDRGARGTVGVEAPEPFHVADALTLQATYRRLLEGETGEDESSVRNAEEA